MLAKYRAAEGDGEAYQYATIYAQWGNRGHALEWLETALRLRRIRLQLATRHRDLALFNLAIDSKLRACDLVKLRVRDVCHGGYGLPGDRAAAEDAASGAV